MAIEKYRDETDEPPKLYHYWREQEKENWESIVNYIVKFQKQTQKEFYS